jgi:diguanylate cyclase (GGDEF)-like protein
MYDYLDSFGSGESIGVLYIDIMGLKRVNDTQGHKEGDKLLNRACKCIQRCCQGCEIFRIGGDEFVVIAKGATEEDIESVKGLLQIDMVRNESPMAIGCEWNQTYDDNIDHLLHSADSEMYEEKGAYYKNIKII